jgi:hypothetical protein
MSPSGTPGASGEVWMFWMIWVSSLVRTSQRKRESSAAASNVGNTNRYARVNEGEVSMAHGLKCPRVVNGKGWNSLTKSKMVFWPSSGDANVGWPSNVSISSSTRQTSFSPLARSKMRYPALYSQCACRWTYFCPLRQYKRSCIHGYTRRQHPQNFISVKIHHI